MKKTMFACSALVLGLIANVASADGNAPLIDDKDDVLTIAGNIVTWLYRAFFVLAVFYILLAAYKYLTARDNAQQVDKATASLKNAVIAIVVALISTGVASVINSFLK